MQLQKHSVKETLLPQLVEVYPLLDDVVLYLQKGNLKKSSKKINKTVSKLLVVQQNIKASDLCPVSFQVSKLPKNQRKYFNKLRKEIKTSTNLLSGRGKKVNIKST